MSKKRTKSGNDKAGVERLVGAAKSAFERGDYATARVINEQIQAHPRAGERAEAAAAMNKRLELDPFLVRFAVVAWFIYLVGWGVGLL